MLTLKVESILDDTDEAEVADGGFLLRLVLIIPDINANFMLVLESKYLVLAVIQL